MTERPNLDLLTMTTEIVVAALGGNENVTHAGYVSGLIAETYKALDECGIVNALASEPEFERAVSPKKSLANPDFIISMIDGKPYKMLRRHIGLHGMTPDQYRDRYGLPADYPMVSASHSEKRRQLALKMGLGTPATGGNGRPRKIKSV